VELIQRNEGGEAQRNEGGEAQRNENERRVSESTDVGQRSDSKLDVHNVPEHHFARHQKSVAVVDRRARAWLVVA